MTAAAAFAANIGHKLMGQNCPIALGVIGDVGLGSRDVVGQGQFLPLAALGMKIEWSLTVMAFDIDGGFAAVKGNVVRVETGLQCNMLE